MQSSYGTWPANAPPWPYFYFPPFSPQDLNPGAASGSNVGSSRSSGGGGVSRTSILTPAIVAIVALLGSAFLLVSYYRVFAKYCTAWQIFWGLRQPDRSSSSGDQHHQSGNGDLEQGWMLHNGGLDEAIVRKIPVYVFKTGQGVVGSNECAVCLGEFEDDDELRLLPKCSHAFHVACIDMWLRSHSNCPLCRAFIVVPQSHQMTRIQHEDDQQPEAEQIQGAAAAEEQQQVEQPGNDGIVSLQIEAASTTHSDHERDASEFPDSQQQPVDLLRRSLSLELGCHHRRGRRKTRLPQMLRRSHSTGSIPFNYLISSSLASNNPDSAEFDKNFIHGTDEYVVLNVELGCSSNSSSQWVIGSIDKDEKLDNLNPSPLHSVRKSRSFRASLMRRSLSAGRVFSFRSFGRSKSNTNALGERQSQV